MRFSIIKTLTLITLLVAFVFSGMAYALDCNTCSSDPTLSSKEAVECGTSCASGNDQNPAQATTQVNNTVKTVISVLSIAVGAVAVIMIIIGGVRYVTSGGKSESVTAAKNTIIYALVGLVIAASAQVLVHFVLFQTSCSTGQISSSQKCK
jgi:hypothetical protein